ncbi:AEC family transporter [Pontibacter anaerobius]|uniref:AEC family transporter n=1 Tax=Pontibacter anaerobius TaxID=2993940 RepID=A0ABT3RHU1_9BACT|nr:AEC family transporter [Pontibacter anaerobius]MCX2741184.1 AEC family transporter [Pontibacter anaerobius]
MSSFILLFGCLGLGLLLQRVKDFPKNTPQVLNQFIIYISLPALALYFIPEVKLDSTVLLPVGLAWICFGAAALFFWGLGKAFGWSRKLVGCLILTGGLGNTSFIGLPVIEALYGADSLETVILIDQPGTFVVLSTVGIALAASFSRGAASIGTIARKIFLFPPFIAFMLALILNLVGFSFSADMKDVFQRLGSTVSPLALVSVGLQLKPEWRSKHWGFLALGLTFQLMLAPLLILGLYFGVLGVRGELLEISVMEAAMAPMITGSIVAASYGLKPRLANMMVGFGIPISFLTLAFWYWILNFVIG